MHRAFGLDLQPLTLGHLFLLREYRSKVLLGSKDTGLGDVLMAAFVCSTSHTQARLNLSRHRGLNRFIARWGKQSRPFDLVQEVRRFYDYFHESFSRPEIAPAADSKSPATGSSEAPQEWCALAMLMSDFHMSRAQALDTGLAMATALWAANAERTGRLNLEPYGMSSGLEAAWKRQHELDLAAQAEKGESSCSA